MGMAAGAEQQQDQAPPSGPLARLSLTDSSAPPNAAGNSGGGTCASASASSSSLPSRTELLEIIRKHSWVLGQAAPSGGDQGGPEVPVDSWFWREVLDMFFVRGAAGKKTPLDDDLLYFVRASADGADDLVMVDEHPQQQQHQYGGEDQDEEPYFVRRLGPSLDKLIGGSAWTVDWCRSVYLNLIQHTSYSLTVAICTREALQTHQQRRSPPSGSPRPPGPPLAPLYKVTKTVYASPARTAFQPDCTAKATATQAAYPDICFAVDDFANTFEAVVLTDSEQCFCVLLDACGGAAIDGRRSGGGVAGSAVEMRSPNDDDDDDAGPSSSSSRSASPKVTLFSGFVSYSMVRSAFDNGTRPRFPGLHLGGAGGGGGSSSRPERLVMRGPGGRGEVDVAVSSVPAAAAAAAAAVGDEDSSRNQQLLDPTASDPPPPSPIKPGAKPGLGTIVWKAALAASTAARNAVIASSNGGKHDLSAPLPLRCCLMSLSLPWNSLAHDLLFK